MFRKKGQFSEFWETKMQSWAERRDKWLKINKQSVIVDYVFDLILLLSSNIVNIFFINIYIFT